MPQKDTDLSDENFKADGQLGKFQNLKNLYPSSQLPPEKHKKGNQNIRGNPVKRIRTPSRRVIEAASSLAVSETNDTPCAQASNSEGETFNVSQVHLAPQIIAQSSSDRQSTSRQIRSQGQLQKDQSLQHTWMQESYMGHRILHCVLGSTKCLYSAGRESYHLTRKEH